MKNTGSVIFGDNVSAVAVGKQVGFSSKTRHLDIRLQFLQDWVQRGVVSLLYCPTQFMIADILTKVPGPAIFDMLRPRVGKWPTAYGLHKNECVPVGMHDVVSNSELE